MMIQFLWAPISKELMESAFAFRSRGLKAGLIASVSQVGNGAYTGYEYEYFASELVRLSTKYNVREIIVERDHLMKGGEDPYEWIPRDKYYGFNMTMLHLHKFADGIPIMEAHSGMKWQLGPGEDDSKPIILNKAAIDMADWVSFPTGCLIDGLSNVAMYAHNFTDRCILPVFGKFTCSSLIRAHNSDYLSVEKLDELKSKGADGINIAPQFGVMQTALYMSIALRDALPINDFLDACEKDEKNAERWCKHEMTRMLCVGHYHWDMLEWRDKYYDDVLYYWLNTLEGMLPWV